MGNLTRTSLLLLLLAVLTSAGIIAAVAPGEIDPSGSYLCLGTMDGKPYAISLFVEKAGETYEATWSQAGQPTHLGVGVADRNELAFTFVSIQESAGTALCHISATALHCVWAFVREPKVETEDCTRHGKDA